MNKTMPSRSKNVTFCIKEKIVDLNWYMFSPQIAGWRQNCSVWTSYIIISICCLNEGSYMIYLNVYNQFYVLQFYIHKKETRQKSAWRRGWRADRRKIWRKSRQFSSFIWLKLLHRWVPFAQYIFGPVSRRPNLEVATRRRRRGPAAWLHHEALSWLDF